MAKRTSTLGMGAALTLLMLSASPVLARNAYRTPANPVAAITSDREIRQFLAQRNAPFWLAEPRAAEKLLGLLESAQVLDGIDQPVASIDELRRLVRKATNGSRRSQRKADHALSRAFVAYAAAIAEPKEKTTIYVDQAARPRPVNASRLLAAAASAPSLADCLDEMRWMHPYYGPLRTELERELSGQRRPERIKLIRLNLERARVLPRGPGRSIVVNTAAARLDFYEGRKVIDSMRVVVGETEQPTPMMAGMVRYAILNPYWHVPPDLTRTRIAPRVLNEGQAYLKKKGYQIVSEWSSIAQIIPAQSVDWRAVADGRKEIYVRQLPGPGNGMGEVKFMFPNDLGIYLHDTPAKNLFTKTERQFSAGCVRLEDAKGLQRLLLGDTPLSTSKKPEQHLPLKQPVPVYLTYMTLVPENGRIVEKGDVYGRDRLALGSGTKQKPIAR